ncbi:MAG: AhpC/TSA family protein [Muribaculaceae bacterium]|nr:AhpC/TSA family protein [Muribaculaceae bacterium]
MRKLLSLITLAVGGIILVNSCGDKKEYVLQGQFGQEYNDKPVLLISMSSGDTLCVDTIKDGSFTIVGDATVADLAQVRIGGAAAGTVVLEPGTINFTPESIGGTPLNDIMNQYNTRYVAMMQELMTIQGDSVLSDSTKRVQIDEVSLAFENYTDSIMFANIDNPVGASFLITKAYEMPLEDLERDMNQYPSLKAYAKLNKIVAQKQLAQETGVGKPYKDFEVTYDGKTTKLSDYMEPGHFTLVDFWASWCGPCRQEIPVIKEIKEEWGSKGLDVVGVAVWDEPQNTINAIDQLGIDWPVMIDAQTIPTDIYGILGIPCIILINPEGIIVSRDLGGEELKAIVAKTMSEAAK